ncbi:MAG: NAD(P)-dependent oxidoreductase [Bacteroidetes bacterium]|nr:NAD(P)-dependent oxidoreductase [Bacteroidota bacterium]
MKTKTIILFGATGTVGGYTALELIAAGYNVIAVGHRKSDNGFFKEMGAVYYSVDITKKEDFKKLPEHNIFAVIHFAGSMPARMETYNPQEYIDTIVSGTLNILDYTQSVSADRIIFSQSISDVAYACGTTNPIPSDIISKFPLNDDHSVYSICKNTAVNFIEHYYHKYGIKRFILRLPNIYLYHPNPFYYVDGIKKWQSYRLLIEKARKGETIEIWGDPTCKRDIIYIKDFTQIVLKSLTANVDGGMYNAGTGIEVSLEEQIKGIVEVFTEDKRSDIIYKKDKPDSPQYIFDISKTMKELNYIPKFDYMAYLLDMKDEMTKQRFSKLWGKE